MNNTVEVSKRDASIGKRFGALLIDGIILWIINMIVFLIAGVSTLTNLNADGTIDSAAISKLLIAGLIAAIINILYYAVLESSSMQATLGKKILKIKVVGRNNQRIRFGKALLRNIVKSLLSLISCIVALFTDHHKALHDMAAGTFVIEDRYQY